MNEVVILNSSDILRELKYQCSLTVHTGDGNDGNKHFIKYILCDTKWVLNNFHALKCMAGRKG